MTSAFKGGIALKRGNAASPEVFTTIAEVRSISGLGKTNDLIDVTNFDSGNTREFIAGLADGSEVTFDSNFIMDNAQQEAVRTSVDNGSTDNYQLVVTNPTTSPINVETFAFAAVAITWTINPSFDDANTMSFTIKISGNITITDS